MAQLVGKESTCNVGNLGLIPGLGRFTGERDRLTTAVFLGFFCDSAGKESACIQETWVQSLGWEDPLEKWWASHSSILAWRIP